ncbi:MAG: aspartate aminotransferase family protein [Myxococcota bacterium]
MNGTQLPEIVTPVPGPESVARIDVLARHECPAITARRARRAEHLGTANDDPVVWDEAVGSNIRDVDGNRFVDWLSGFGVTLVGHRHPTVVAAAQAQADKLPHAMGDAWPDQSRIRLLERLAAFAPDPLSVIVLGLSGSDAIDAAVKTARLATGRAGVLTFEGGYHGLALGVVGLQSARPQFTEPFADIVHPHVHRLPLGASPHDVEALLQHGEIGLVLGEPMQGRGGFREAPQGFWAETAAIARRHGALFAFDEVLTGMGRTGVPFACTDEGVIPDLLCVGKALAGGWPLSACIGTPEAMAAWGASQGEAIHTQTFLGHPVGCAAALGVFELFDQGLLDAIQARSRALDDRFEGLRGRGLMRALALRPGSDALAVSRQLLQEGHLILPADAESLQITPAVTLSDAQIDHFAGRLEGLGALL